MVNPIKGYTGFLVTCDIPMAQFLVSLHVSKPASQQFITHVLDTTHLFVKDKAEKTILYEINEYRKRTTYDKPEKTTEQN